MNAAQKKFVDEMVKHGDENRAVVAAYPHLNGNNKQIRNYCGRLMKNDEVAAAIKELSKKISDRATNEAVLELKDKIVANTLSVIEKRNLLAQIARGEILVQQHYFDKDIGGMESFFREPDPGERMKAIDLDNKMTGDNAPDKLNVENTAQVTIFKLPDNGRD